MNFSFFHSFYLSRIIFENSHDKDAVKHFGYILHTQHSTEVKNEHDFCHIDMTFVYSKRNNYRRGLPFLQCNGIASVRS